MSEEERDYKLPGSFISDMDQILAGNEQIAKMVANYFDSLQDAGMPIEIAEKMALEMNRRLWAQAFPGRNDG